jgi:hypothetical protein
MSANNQIELCDETIYPDEKVLSALFGDGYPAYRELLKLYDANEMEYTWRYYHDGKAWLCKVQKKKRTIVWMSAWRGFIKATIYIPEKHIDAIYKLEISEARRQMIRDTKNTGTSKPCIFEIRNVEVLEDFDKVMQFKIASK